MISAHLQIHKFLTRHMIYLLHQTATTKSLGIYALFQGAIPLYGLMFILSMIPLNPASCRLHPPPPPTILSGRYAGSHLSQAHPFAIHLNFKACASLVFLLKFVLTSIHPLDTGYHSSQLFPEIFLCTKIFLHRIPSPFLFLHFHDSIFPIHLYPVEFDVTSK